MQVIVNADDFGRHSDINAGIIEACEQGVVTRASLMVNFPVAVEAVQLAQRTPALSVGLHFNISSGRCKASPARLPLLVDDSGIFTFESEPVPRAMSRLHQTVDDHPEILDQIEREFWSQVEASEKLGLKIAHLDIHHYLSLVHISLFDRYIELAEHLGVPVRGMCYPMLDMLRVPLAVRDEMRTRIVASPCWVPDISLGNLLGSRPLSTPSGSDYQQMVEAKLLVLSAQGAETIELVTHPCRMTSVVWEHDSYAWARGLETFLVRSASFGDFLRSGC